jgi:MFS family permease
MRAIASSATARRLFVTSVIARLPLAMLSVGLMVHIQRLTGFFAAAGVVTAAYGIAVGVGGPVLGRLVDRRGGQTVVLLATGWIAGALLGAITLLPDHVSLVVLTVLAAGVGLATPPVGACLRAQLPSLLTDPSAVRAAYAFDTSIVELTWICGPPLVLGLGVLWSTAGALAAAALLLVVLTIGFATQRSSHESKPAPMTERRIGGALRAPAMRTLTLALLGIGVLLGADEIAVTAAARAWHETTTAAAPLLALWGAGSFAGGLLVTRFGRDRGTAAGPTRWLAALAAAHLALIPPPGAWARWRLPCRSPASRSRRPSRPPTRWSRLPLPPGRSPRRSRGCSRRSSSARLSEPPPAAPSSTASNRPPRSGWAPAPARSRL